MVLLIGTNGNEDGVDLPILKGTNKSDVIIGDEGDGSGVATLDAMPNAPISYGNDILSGFRRSDVLIGDLETFSFLIESDAADASLGNMDVFNEKTISSANIIFGMDKLDGGNGSDELYGDLHTFDLEMAAGNSTGGNSVYGISFANASGNNITFGMDELEGGKGNDDLYGDLHTFNWNLMTGNATGGTGSPSSGALSYFNAQGNYITFAADVLNGGNGNDNLYGDLHTFNWSMTGGNATGGNVTASAISNSNSNSTSRTESHDNEIIFGMDELHGGTNADDLYGDLGDFNWSIIAGAAMGGSAIATDVTTTVNIMAYASATSLAIANSNDITFGMDTLNGDEGTDTLYGDLQTFDWDIVAGTASGGYANSSGGFTSIGFSIIATADAQAIANADGNNVTFAMDEINGGEGIDSIYGDLQTFDWDVVAGTAAGGDVIVMGSSTAPTAMNFASATAHANASSSDNNIIFGMDTLNGDEGTDTLYGDLQTFDWDIVAGTATVGSLTASGFGNGDFYAHANSSSSNNNITFGMDTIDGGIGTDTLYGDLEILNWNLVSGSADAGIYNDAFFASATASALVNTVSFGDDILTGGRGDDIMWGDASLLTVTLDDSLGGGVAFESNTINMGQDTFVFDLDGGLLDFGADSVGDFYTLITDGGLPLSDISHLNAINIDDMGVQTTPDLSSILTLNHVGDILEFHNLFDANSDTFTNIDDLLAISEVEEGIDGSAKLVFSDEGGENSSITFANIEFDGINLGTEISDYIDVSQIIIVVA